MDSLKESEGSSETITVNNKKRRAKTKLESDCKRVKLSELESKDSCNGISLIRIVCLSFR